MFSPNRIFSFLKAWGPAMVLTIGLAGLIGWSSLQPRDGRPVAVVMPPWTDFSRSAAAVAAAGGAIKAVGAWDWILSTTISDPQAISVLHRQGAWLVVDASQAAGCFGL